MGKIIFTNWVKPTPPINESQVAVTSHCNALERSGHNNQLLNIRVDRNNS